VEGPFRPAQLAERGRKFQESDSVAHFRVQGGAPEAGARGGATSFPASIVVKPALERATRGECRRVAGGCSKGGSGGGRTRASPGAASSTHATVGSSTTAGTGARALADLAAAMVQEICSARPAAIAVEEKHFKKGWGTPAVFSFPMFRDHPFSRFSTPASRLASDEIECEASRRARLRKRREVSTA